MMSDIERYISPANRKVESDDALIARARADAERIANRAGMTIIEMEHMPQTCDGIWLRFIVGSRA